MNSDRDRGGEITTKQTTVFVAQYGKRSKRFFSWHSAAQWLARQAVRDRIPNYYGGAGDEALAYENYEYQAKAAARLVRWWANQRKQAKEAAQ